MIFSSPDTYIF